MFLNDLPFPAIPSISTFCSSRQGGISRGNYADLNLGDHVGDDPNAVMENRQRLQQQLHRPQLNTVYLQQVHGTTATLITDAPPKFPPQADAVVTQQADLLLAIMTADCLPVLFAHPQSGVIAAAHAGWRGARDGILENTLAGMQRLGAVPQETIAMLGPCIRQPHYEVDGAFYAQFMTDDGDNTVFFQPSPHHTERWMFDLPGYAKWRLLRAGVALPNVYDCERCTYQEETLLFSHRRATHRGHIPCGRQISGIYRRS
ncbi:peptidoglycan editing factor PgeF [Magnetococcus marinus]|nr:peptidoglycan editing factor PgeF [Magnetococcus marinus]